MRGFVASGAGARGRDGWLQRPGGDCRDRHRSRCRLGSPDWIWNRLGHRGDKRRRSLVAAQGGAGRGARWARGRSAGGAWLSATTLLGLGLNAVLGWWWADPVAALAMLPLIVREGLEAWRGEPPPSRAAGGHAHTSDGTRVHRGA